MSEKLDQLISLDEAATDAALSWLRADAKEDNESELFLALDEIGLLLNEVAGASLTISEADKFEHVRDKWASFLFRHDFSDSAFLPESRNDFISAASSLERRETETALRSDQKERGPSGSRRQSPKMIKGTVVKRSGDKTVKVSLEPRRYKDKRTGKYLTRRKSILAHDEFNQADEGQSVLIIETRPLSKSKRHRLLAVKL